MYAVIHTGGKQYRVQEGEVLRVEKLSAEAGSQIEFDRVLLVGEGEALTIGRPFVEGGKVTATVRAVAVAIGIVQWHQDDQQRRPAAAAGVVCMVCGCRHEDLPARRGTG